MTTSARLQVSIATARCHARGPGWPSSSLAQVCFYCSGKEALNQSALCAHRRSSSIFEEMICAVVIYSLSLKSSGMFVPGTNLQALIEQAKHPSSSAEIVVVISNRPGVLGLKKASLAGIQTQVKTNNE